MGFPVGYTEVFLPSLLLNTLGLLGLFRAFLLSLLHFLGLSSLLEPAPPNHHFLLPGPARPYPPTHALLIREHLPVMQFSDALATLKSSAGDAAAALPAERCAICLYEFHGGEEVSWPINCRHIFHRSCLDRWIDHDQRTCPLCRARLLGADLMEEFHQRLVFADQYDDDDDDDDFHDHYPWSSHY